MIEAPPQEVCALLIEALAQATGMPVPPVAFAQAHRWRYSQGSDLAHRQAIYDPTDQLGICGDWLASGKIEGAYRSGMLLAEKILQSTDASAITHN
jgi:predicted NAD/FAD-dependent oxidoreductase